MSREPLHQIMRIKKKLTIIFVAALTAFFILSSSSFSATYYISSSQGKDTNTGLSASAPWRTLYRLKQVVLLPGDSVYLRRGDTWRGKLFIFGSGTSTQRITITSYGTGNKPVINGSEIINAWSAGSTGVYMYVSWSAVERWAVLEDGKPIRKASSTGLFDGNWFYQGSTIYYRPTTAFPKDHLVEASWLDTLITLDTRHNITVDGLAFYGGEDGIQIIDSYEIVVQNCDIFASANFGISLRRRVPDARSDTITISGNNISYNANGLYILCKQDGDMSTGYNAVKVFNNTITYTNYQNVWAHKTKDGHAIGVQNTSLSRFEGNVLLNNYTGIVTWTGKGYRSDNNAFVRNFIDSSERVGVAFGGGPDNSSEGNIWAYNIIANCGKDQSEIWGGARISGRQVAPNYFVNNTLYNNDVNIYLNAIPDYYVIKNNISLSPANYHVVMNKSAGTHNVWDNNGYFSPGTSLFVFGSSRDLSFTQWKNQIKQEKSSLSSDPMLSSIQPTKVEDFTLKTESPYIQKGVPVPIGLQYDFFGMRIDTPPSIGASAKAMPKPTNLRSK